MAQVDDAAAMAAGRVEINYSNELLRSRLRLCSEGVGYEIPDNTLDVRLFYEVKRGDEKVQFHPNVNIKHMACFHGHSRL